MLKKILKGLGLLVALLGLAVLVFWVGWLRAPAQAEVCAHIRELTVGLVEGVKPRGRCEFVSEIGENILTTTLPADLVAASGGLSGGQDLALRRSALPVTPDGPLHGTVTSARLAFGASPPVTKYSSSRPTRAICASKRPSGPAVIGSTCQARGSD